MKRKKGGIVGYVILECVTALDSPKTDTFSISPVQIRTSAVLSGLVIPQTVPKMSSSLLDPIDRPRREGIFIRV